MHHWHWILLNQSRFALRRYTVKELGVFTVVAAGNKHDNACHYSPACRKDVITVGNYDNTHTRRFDSNYGNCVDAWGPGTDMVSSKAGDTEEYGIDSGTSMASPIIAGIVGQFLNLKPDINLEQIKEFLADKHTKDLYSFSINDCRSPQCRAFSMECADLGFIASGTQRPTATPRPTVNPTGPSPSPTASPTAGPSAPTLPGMNNFRPWLPL